MSMAFSEIIEHLPEDVLAVLTNMAVDLMTVDEVKVMSTATYVPYGSTFVKYRREIDVPDKFMFNAFCDAVSLGIIKIEAVNE